MEDLVFRTSERVPQLVIDVLETKGYREQEETDAENNWHVHWKAGRFKPSEYAAANRMQRVNHFPKTTGITKKDTLLRNLRRMRAIHGQIFNFFPESCAAAPLAACWQRIAASGWPSPSSAARTRAGIFFPPST